MTGTVSIPVQLTFGQLLDAISQLSKQEQYQLLLHVLHKHEDDNLIVTHFATEKILAKDWDTAEEDKAWQDL